VIRLRSRERQGAPLATRPGFLRSSRCTLGPGRLLAGGATLPTGRGSLWCRRLLAALHTGMRAAVRPGCFGAALRARVVRIGSRRPIGTRPTSRRTWALRTSSLQTTGTRTLRARGLRTTGTRPTSRGTRTLGSGSLRTIGTWPSGRRAGRLRAGSLRIAGAVPTSRTLKTGSLRTVGARPTGRRTRGVGGLRAGRAGPGLWARSLGAGCLRGGPAAGVALWAFGVLRAAGGGGCVRSSQARDVTGALRKPGAVRAALRSRLLRAAVRGPRAWAGLRKAGAAFRSGKLRSARAWHARGDARKPGRLRATGTIVAGIARTRSGGGLARCVLASGRGPGARSTFRRGCPRTAPRWPGAGCARLSRCGRARPTGRLGGVWHRGRGPTAGGTLRASGGGRRAQATELVRAR
jgi:hypothetical protein